MDRWICRWKDGWMNEYNWYNKTNKVDLGL